MARRGGHSRSGYENVVFLGRENNAATHAQRTFCRLATVKLKDTRVTVKAEGVLRLGLRAACGEVGSPRDDSLGESRPSPLQC